MSQSLFVINGIALVLEAVSVQHKCCTSAALDFWAKPLNTGVNVLHSVPGLFRVMLSVCSVTVSFIWAG